MMRLLALARYLGFVLASGQRWVGPGILQVLAVGTVLGSPPVDTLGLGLGLVLGTVFCTSAWLGFSLQAMETPEQAAVTALLLGSVRALAGAKAVLAWVAGWALLVLGFLLATGAGVLDRRAVAGGPCRSSGARSPGSASGWPLTHSSASPTSSSA